MAFYLFVQTSVVAKPIFNMGWRRVSGHIRVSARVHDDDAVDAGSVRRYQVQPAATVRVPCEREIASPRNQGRACCLDARLCPRRRSASPAAVSTHRRRRPSGCGGPKPRSAPRLVTSASPPERHSHDVGGAPMVSTLKYIEAPNARSTRASPSRTGASGDTTPRRRSLGSSASRTRSAPTSRSTSPAPTRRADYLASTRPTPKRRARRRRPPRAQGREGRRPR